jgi:hypothetical protein
MICSVSLRLILGLQACINYVVKRSGVEPPCRGVLPMQNPPILRGGLENADLFPMSGPASWCFLIPKRFCKVSIHPQKLPKARLDKTLDKTPQTPGLDSTAAKPPTIL